MSVVNFTIPKPLEQKIADAIEQQGFASKAEFFRFAALRALEAFQGQMNTLDRDYALVMQKLAETMKRKYRGKKLPPLEEQLADL